MSNKFRLSVSSQQPTTESPGGTGDKWMRCMRRTYAITWWLCKRACGPAVKFAYVTSALILYASVQRPVCTYIHTYICVSVFVCSLVQKLGVPVSNSCFSSSCLVIMLLTMDTYILFDFGPIVVFGLVVVFQSNCHFLLICCFWFCCFYSANFVQLNGIIWK